MLKYSTYYSKIIILILFKITFLSCCSSILYSQQDKEPENLLYSNFYYADSLLHAKDYLNSTTAYELIMDDFRENEWDVWYKAFVGYKKSMAKMGEITILVDEISDLLFEYNIDQSNVKGKVLFSLGFYERILGNIIRSNEAYKMALHEFNINSISPSILKATYKNLSLNYSSLGDQKSAIKYSDEALKLIANDSSSVCGIQLNKSKYLFYDNRFEEAKNLLLSSLEFCNSNYDRSFIYQYLAEIFIKLDSLEIAKDYLDLSSKLNPNVSSQYLVIKAEYLKKMNQGEDAKNQYEKALEILINFRDRRIYVKTLIEYSDLLYHLNEKEESISKVHLALLSKYEYLDSLDISDRPNMEEPLPDIWIIEALYSKARYFREQYLEDNDEFSLNEATYYYDLLLSHFDKLKSNYYSSSSQYRMGSYSQKIYSEIITFFIDQFNQNSRNRDLENAFSLAQRANSFVLRNAVSDRKALEMAGVQQDSLEQYLLLALKVASEIDKDSIAGANTISEFDAYQKSLLINYPSYGKYEKNEEITIEELQSALKPNSLLVKYYYYDNVLSVLGVTKHSIFAENIRLSGEVDSIVNINLEILSQNESNDSLESVYLTNSKRVYDLVLGDLLDKYNLGGVDHLIIVPDGPLKKVAFNALATKDSDNWNDPNTYLMSKYAVNYLYYCSQLKNQNKEYTSKNGFVGFGIEYKDDFLKEIVRDYMSNFKDNSDDSRAISLSPLQYADDEVLTSAQILDGTSFINSDVTPFQVFSTINNFDVVHFSAHAFVDEDDYLNSFVVLNKDDDENYQLKYSDILNLDIDSELVVLSACQTSSGKSVVGEGLMSLSRAFVQSGSNAAVGAYWNAPDYATKELMTLFYSNLNDGMSKSKAMQQAQIEYLTNDKISSPTIRSPFFWASWAVYGNDDPLHMSTSILDFDSWKSYLLLAVLGILLIFMIKYFSKK